MFSLQTRMYLLLAALFAIIYATIVVIGTAAGLNDFYFYLIISVGMMWVQFMIGPNIIEWTMKVRYVTQAEEPKLWAMVAEMTQRANMPMPRLCVSPSNIPNAFAFGRGPNDGRVCIHEGLRRLLTEEELKAVVGHELAHLKNNDVLTMTLISVIPMIMYRIAWHFMWAGNRRSDRNASNGMMVGLVAMLFYFITSLLVLYGSRIREYYADKGSVDMGNRPAALASALYKLVYGSARLAKTDEMKQVEGMKAFFLNDPSQALNEIRELKQVDIDNSGTIDSQELARLRTMDIKVKGGEKILEFMSTHPNMLKRIKHLSELA